MGAAVEYSDDFDRVVAMPRREISEARGRQLSKELSPMLLTPEGRRHPVWGQGLQWLQALAIDEAVQQDGAYLQLPVGSGKTLLTWLFAYIFEARNPVLVVPESLIEKTRIEFQQYARFWVRPKPPPKVIGLKMLTQDHNVDWLKKWGADLYLLDEVDMLKNQDSSMVKRLARDIDARNVRTIAMTGTGGRFSILDISHLITWALKENAPVPLDHDECCRWAEALDEKKKWTGFGKGSRRRMQPGVLISLAPLTKKDDPDLDELQEIGYARAAFRKRLTQTRGCIISDTDSCDKPITIKHTRAPQDRAIERAFRDLNAMKTPSGEDIIDSLSFHMLQSAIGEGHCPRWKEPPPTWWSDPRREYAKLCKEVIRRTAWSEDPRDTPKAVKRLFPRHPTVLEWEEVKDEWEGERETDWISSSVVEAAAEWATRKHGIVWTKSIVFGEALARLTGLPFYGAEGKDARGRSVELDSGRDTIVCSVASNLRGRNLQDRWHRNLLVGGVQSARSNEQLYGRTHRYGQKHPVEIEIMLTSGGSLYSFERAKLEAKFVHATQGHRQKILRAKHITCPLPTGEERWKTKPEKKRAA